MINKELRSAKYDLARAKNSLQDDDAKWATIQGYYTMFHCARALIFHQDYGEKSHRCLLAALQELFVDRREMPVQYLENLREAMDLREDADYGFIYSKESANSIIHDAQDFYNFTKRYLKSDK
jgi:uncharacterized protein (UPF0332 family)